MSALLVASLGTDTHPFQRLVDWLDAMAVAHPDAEVVVQHGHSAAPVVALGHDFLPHADLLELMHAANVVVSHGGPGTIMDAHRCGRVPVVVPRDPQLGEHVDGHQLRFAQTIAQGGRAVVATTKGGFERAVREGLRADRSQAPGETAIRPAGLSTLVAELDRLPEQASRLEPWLRPMRRRMRR